MDERIGMDHFERAGIVDRILYRATYGLARCESNDRTQALTAVEEAITHRFEEAGFETLMRRNGRRQRAFDERSALR